MREVCELKDVPNSVLIGAGIQVERRYFDKLKSLGFVNENGSRAHEIYFLINELLRRNVDSSYKKAQKSKTNKLKEACASYIRTSDELTLIERMTEIQQRQALIRKRNESLLDMQDCFYEIVKSVVKAFEEGNDIVTFSGDSTYVITQKTFIIINSNGYQYKIYQQGGTNSHLDSKIERLKIIVENQNADLLNQIKEENHQ